MTFPPVKSSTLDGLLSNLRNSNTVANRRGAAVTVSPESPIEIRKGRHETFAECVDRLGEEKPISKADESTPPEPRTSALSGAAQVSQVSDDRQSADSNSEEFANPKQEGVSNGSLPLLNLEEFILNSANPLGHAELVVDDGQVGGDDAQPVATADWLDEEPEIPDVGRLVAIMWPQAQDSLSLLPPPSVSQYVPQVLSADASKENVARQIASEPRFDRRMDTGFMASHGSRASVRATSMAADDGGAVSMQLMNPLEITNFAGATEKSNLTAKASIATPMPASPSPISRQQTVTNDPETAGSSAIESPGIPELTESQNNQIDGKTTIDGETNTTTSRLASGTNTVPSQVMPRGSDATPWDMASRQHLTESSGTLPQIANRSRLQAESQSVIGGQGLDLEVNPIGRLEEDRPRAVQVYSTNMPVIVGADGNSSIRFGSTLGGTVSSAHLMTQVREGVLHLAVSRNPSAFNSLRMELHPAELGSIEINLEQSDRGLEIAVHCSRETTRHMLEERHWELRQTLADAGIDVADFQCSDHRLGDRADSKWEHAEDRLAADQPTDGDGIRHAVVRPDPRIRVRTVDMFV